MKLGNGFFSMPNYCQTSTLESQTCGPNRVDERPGSTCDL